MLNMKETIFDLDFYRGKRVFVTGHTGFKGTWLCRMLLGAGAVVTGYSLNAPTEPNLFALADVESRMTSVIGDVRDFKHLKETFDAAKPQIVLHLAAQPIVRDSYKDPVYTYEINGVKEELISRRISSRIGNTVILYRNTKTLEIIEDSGFSYKSGIILALLGVILILYSVLSGIGII